MESSLAQETQPGLSQGWRTGPQCPHITSTPGAQPPQGPAQRPAELPQMEAELTCVVESKEQGAGDGEGQDPDDGDHNSDSALGAVACVVEHGHGHSRVPARAQWGGTPHSMTRTQKRRPSPWGWTVGPLPADP